MIATTIFHISIKKIKYNKLNSETYNFRVLPIALQTLANKKAEKYSYIHVKDLKTAKKNICELVNV